VPGQADGRQRPLAIAVSKEAGRSYRSSGYGGHPDKCFGTGQYISMKMLKTANRACVAGSRLMRRLSDDHGFSEYLSVPLPQTGLSRTLSSFQAVCSPTNVDASMNLIGILFNIFHTSFGQDSMIGSL